MNSLGGAFALPTKFLLSTSFGCRDHNRIRGVALGHPRCALGVNLHGSLFGSTLDVRTHTGSLLLNYGRRTLLCVRDTRVGSLS